MINLEPLWGARWNFTAKERARLREIFKQKEGAVDQFIDRVERFLPEYIDVSNVIEKFPIEAEKDTRKRLMSVARKAKELALAIDKLHPYFSGERLENVNLRTGPLAVDVDELRTSLESLTYIAAAAAKQARQRGAGRPRSRMHYSFIRQCHAAYQETFGHVPPCGHRSMFQNFIVEVSTCVLPDGQGLQGNITRLITAALADEPPA